jgi:hypothetical protein
MKPDPRRSGLDQMSAVLAGTAAGGATAVVGFLHFATGFGHGGLQCLAKSQQVFNVCFALSDPSVYQAGRLLGSGIELLPTGEFIGSRRVIIQSGSRAPAGPLNMLIRRRCYGQTCYASAGTAVSVCSHSNGATDDLSNCWIRTVGNVPGDNWPRLVILVGNLDGW